MSLYNWYRYTAAEAMRRIRDQQEEPWIAVGDFLDDWRRSANDDRAALVYEPLEEAVETLQLRQWAAFFAAVVEELCIRDEVPVPPWVMDQKYILPEPWYLEAKSLPLRTLQEETTPTAFKKRNVLGGDRMLDRI